MTVVINSVGSVSSPCLWESVHAQAMAWAETGVVREVAAEMPRNVPLKQCRTGAKTIAAFLVELRSKYSGLRPLMFGTLIPFLLSQDEMPPRSRVEQEDLARWLSATQRLEQAHRVTLAWFRSRLPGYPLIPAPQLGRETAYTTHEYSPRFIWTPDERGLVVCL